MVEANFSEYYKTKTPIELNRELGMLIEQLPEAPSETTLDKLMHIAQERKGSVDWQICEARLKSLLVLANITPSFKEFIAEAFTISYGLGEEKPASIRWIIDQDGSGIFDSSTSKEFDRIGCQIQSTNLSGFYASLSNLVSKSGLPGDVSDYFSKVLNNQSILDATKHVRKWRQEFINKYGEEP